MPAIVIVPVRALPLVLSVIWNVTVPLPEPVAPVTTVIHCAFDVAVQVQPAVVVTVTGPPLCAADVNDALVESSE